MSELVFSVNGEIYRLKSPNPSERLVDFLRRETGYTGTKIGCGEGGCGSCAVLLQKSPDAVARTINSCLAPLCAMHGMAITTIEGLGGSTHPEGFHPVQNRVADFNGSQCGFCTPGMVMAMYGAIEARDGAPSTKDMASCLDGNLCRCTGYRPLLDAAKSLAASPSVEVKDQVGMTGAKAQTGPLSTEEFKARRPVFPPILAAATARADAECTPGVKGVPSPRWSQGGRHWFYPRTFQAVLDTVSYALQNTDATQPLHARFKIVAGNTSAGVYKAAVSDPSILIYLGGVAELSGSTAGDTGVRFGAATSIANAIAALEKAASASPTTTKHFEVIIAHMSKIAGAHVRGAGSLAGNLMMARHWGFESDLATVFMAAGATLELIRIDGASVSAPTTTTLEGFFAIPKTEQVVIEAVTVPWSDPSEVMRTYKVALRPQNSHALVNAGFRIKTGADDTISAATLVYGAVGTPHAVHASAAEKFMVGRTLKALSTDKDQREKLFALLKSEVPVPSLGSAKADAVHRVTYRRGLVTAFMSKFLSEPSSPTLGPDVLCAAPGGYTRRVSVATQNLPGIDTGAPMTDDWYTDAPVGLPVPKLSARLQASGEAKYTADGPLPNRTGYGAFAQAYAVGRTVTALQTEKAMASPGVIRIVTAKDIRGENNSVFGGSSVERLLVQPGGDPVKYAGEPVCIVVAATKQQAHEAAALVTVTYKETTVPSPTPDAEHPPTNLRDAIKHKVFLKRNDKTCHHERHDSGCATLTDALDACAHVVNGEVELGTQKHFPIETHTALAIPDEGGRMKVWSSCQGIGSVQTAVARVLFGSTADRSMVHVKCRRVGGGFGAKLSRHLPVACAAALAAQASRRPVLMAITRAQDMEMTGGRHDTIAQYSAGYDKSGRILALRIAVHMDAGWCPDLTSFCAMAMTRSMDQVYYIPEFEVDVQPYLTATPTRSAVRGPSELEPSYIAETIISHVAHACGCDAETVRERNIPGLGLEWPKGKPLIAASGQEIAESCWTVPRMWKEIKRTADFDKRREAIRAFNKKSPHVKRGIAITSLKYAVGARFRQALVNIISDGSIQVTHSGMESGQGIHTKVAQATAYGLGKLLEDDDLDNATDAAASASAAPPSSERKGLLSIYPEAVAHGRVGPLLRHVHVTDSDSEKIPNISMTGGSTTSEGCVGAALVACAELVRRLRPVKASVLAKKRSANEKKEEADRVPVTATWQEIIAAASGSNVSLSAARAWRRGRSKEQAESPDEEISHRYFIFGVGCSEVEVDQLTGETKVLRVDILYDAGKPLNPAVDLGQIEGAFVMGIGMVLREQVIRVDADTEGKGSDAVTTPGVLWNNGTWEYKLPCSQDVPVDMRVSYLSNSKYPRFVLSSKATGEPPLVLACSVAMALRDAIASTRGADSEFFQMPTPVMVDNIATLMQS